MNPLTKAYTWSVATKKLWDASPLPNAKTHLRIITEELYRVKRGQSWGL